MIGQKTKHACDEPGILQLSCLQIIGATARVKINIGSKSAIFQGLSQISAIRDQLVSVLKRKIVEFHDGGGKNGRDVPTIGVPFWGTIGTKPEEVGGDACFWIHRWKAQEAIT